jgi:uncharacterized protein
MIEINERFEVAAPPDVVWAVLSDPHAVVGCVPGAALVAEHPDGSFDGSLSVKFGPLAVGFQARVTLDLEAATRLGHLVAQGRDKQGGTRFKGSATFQVSPVEAGSRVVIDSGVELSGRLASVVESGAEVVVRRMSTEFAARLAARCAVPVTEG